MSIINLLLFIYEEERIMDKPIISLPYVTVFIP